MTGAPPAGSRRVVVVTGGGGGIGAAIAEELGRQGAFVVTMDPLVTLDGAEQLPTSEETTAGRIVAAGGAARASAVSVTDGDAVRALFAELVDEHGRLDGVINVAGITRPTSFARGTEDDWRGVLSVHLDGYLNVLGAALPIMADAGRGRILGITSGSGWRAADAGAYACAKRAVAALTWELGREAPPGVAVNAMSPIAVTRMVTAALGRAGGSGSKATGGLALGSMPQPEDIGPFGAHLVGEELSWCSGEVLFSGGSEVAVIERPRLLEVVRTADVGSLAGLLEAVTAGALAAAEERQASGGGSNPRFDSAYEAPRGEVPVAAATSCAVVSDRLDVRAAITSALEGRGVTCTTDLVDDVDAVVVCLAGGQPADGAPTGWPRILAEHAGIAEQIHADAMWARAVADLAARVARPVRLVTLVDAATAGGRSRAQAATQLSRAARGATDGRVAAFAVSDEGASGHEMGEVVAHLVCSAEAASLSGAELVAGAGWFGLRSHPRPSASITLGGAAIPPWLDGTLRTVVGARR